MKPARRLRIFGLVASAGILLLILFGASRWKHLQDSLPPLDGERRLPGLGGTATLSRDSLGTAAVRASDEADAARVIGFAHGQDRFFQMDLLRRQAAGELSALVGPAGVLSDRSTRVHRFRETAAIVLDREPARRRALLAAYAEGVNAGLASLQAHPWEYLALGAEPEPWTPVDSVLVLYAMTFDLQDSTGRYDLTLNALRTVVGRGGVDFFNPVVGPSDAALDGTAAPLPEPPGPLIIDLRNAIVTARETAAADAGRAPARVRQASNAFAIAARQPGGGPALLAGDPHLDLSVPNTWYRAQLEWTGANGTPVRVTGVTLPGVPAIVIGSNGRLAWSFTNSFADTGDLVALDLNQTAPEIFYHRGRDLLEFEKRTDTIVVRDEDPVAVESVWTIWGPIVGRTERGKQLAYKWTMHDPAAANLDLLDLATAATIDEGIAIAHRCGIPPQTAVFADSAGRTAWTIAGRLPRRFGFDGRFPVSWTYGDRGWNGYLDPDDVPVIRAKPGGALWSANQRPLGGDALGALGDGGYFEGDRAGQIRDHVAELASASGPAPQPEDLLAVQLDIRGRWLERWRERLLGTLDEGALKDHPRRAALHEIVADSDEPLSATIDSVPYRVVREWHDQLSGLTLRPIFARCLEIEPGFDARLLRTEEALWALHRDEPPHLLSPDHRSWRELRLAAADAAIRELERRAGALRDAAWGERNRAAILHPLSPVLPLGIGRWLSLPPDPLPGDHHLPRVQRPAFGASLRMVVSPGREEKALLHLPAGQSGHPVSPYYRAGHAAWAAGEPLPLLPGEPEHTLTLQP